jgi:hypothetical protein
MHSNLPPLNRDARTPKDLVCHAAAGVIALAGTYRRLPKSGAAAKAAARPVANADGARYRYEQLSEGLAHGRSTRSLADEPPGAPRQPCEFRLPTEAEQVLMASLGIQFDGQAYHFAGYRYDRLADAVKFARQAQGPT